METIVEMPKKYRTLTAVELWAKYEESKKSENA